MCALSPELGGLGNYAIASNRASKVIQEIVAQAATGTGARRCVGFRVLLFNDRFNKRAHVEAVLKEFGLSAEEARVAMMSAHTMGRGAVRSFDIVRSIGDREDDVRAASKLRPCAPRWRRRRPARGGREGAGVSANE